MSKDDMHVVMYKILVYFYECFKKGVPTDARTCLGLAGVNEAYFTAVVIDLHDHFYIKGKYETDMNGEAFTLWNLTITSDGVAYLEENSMMGKVRNVIGSSYGNVLATALGIAQLM